MNTKSGHGNILIVRLSSLGDVVMATPVIKAVKKAYPEHRLTWLVEEKAKDVITGNPLIDRVIVCQKDEWKRLLKKGRMIALIRRLMGFIKELRMERYDVAYDLQGLLKSAIWAYISGARIRIGLDSKEGSRFLLTQTVSSNKSYNDAIEQYRQAMKRSPHNVNKQGWDITSKYRRLIEGLGIDPGDFLMDLPLGQEEEAFITAFRTERGLKGSYAVISPFTTRPQKHWVEGRWGEIIRETKHRFGMPVVILGGREEIKSSQRIEAIAGGNALNMTGMTTVKQAFAFIKYSSLIIGVDTGLTHSGFAFNIPTVVIFGSTCPYTHAAGYNGIILSKWLSCSPCRRRPTCNGSLRCMDGISVSDVLNAAAMVLSRR